MPRSALARIEVPVKFTIATTMALIINIISGMTVNSSISVNPALLLRLWSRRLASKIRAVDRKSVV